MNRTALILTLVLVSSTMALASAPRQRAVLSTGEYTIVSENFTLNNRTGEFNFPSHVRFTQPGADVVGDRAQGNKNTRQVTVTGNVVLHNSRPVSSVGISAPSASGEPQTLTTDQLQIDAAQKVYVATGNVRFLQGGSVVTADRGSLNTGSHQLDLSGNVHITQADGNSMTGNHVLYDTLDETVNMNGNLHMRSPVRPEALPPAPPTRAPSAKPKKS